MFNRMEVAIDFENGENGDMVPLFAFISTGGKAGFYTFRVMYSVRVYVPGVGCIIQNKSYFHRNLSTNAQTAESMAQDIADQCGLPLKGGADFDLMEIQRRKHEEVEAHKEAIRLAVEKKEREHFELVQRQIKEGVILCGKLTGKTAAQAYAEDISTFFWFVGQYSEDAVVSNRFEISAKLCYEYATANGLKYGVGFIGEVGETVTVKVKLLSSRWTNGRFPSVMFKCLAEDNKLVTFFTTSKKLLDLKEGEEFSVKGIVKEHYTGYNGTQSTTINKPKLA